MLITNSTTFSISSQHHQVQVEPTTFSPLKTKRIYAEQWGRKENLFSEPINKLQSRLVCLLVFCTVSTSTYSLALRRMYLRKSLQ